MYLHDVECEKVLQLVVGHACSTNNRHFIEVIGLARLLNPNRTTIVQWIKLKELVIELIRIRLEVAKDLKLNMYL